MKSSLKRENITTFVPAACEYFSRLGITLTVAITIICPCCFASDEANLQQLTKDGNTKMTLPLLVEQIEREWPVGIERDSSNKITTVNLPVKQATDENLRLLATSATLRSLSFSYNPRLGQPTSFGIRALRQASELKSVQVQCVGEIPSDFLEGLSELSQIESLTLLSSIPRDPGSYSLLTNAVGLVDLNIRLPRRFGSQEILAIAAIKQLQQLSIVSRDTSEPDCAPLLANKALTNLVIETGSCRIHVTRTQK